MLLFILLLSTLLQQPDDVKELTRLEAVWNDAHTSGNAAALDSLWAEDLTVIVPGMRPFNKKDVLGVMRSGRMKFLRYQTSDIQVRVYGDAAVVTGMV